VNIYLIKISDEGWTQMNIAEIQKQVDETNYWDLLILDLEIKYFGDEVLLYIEKDRTSCYRISFTFCYKLNYETDANWRGDFMVKNSGPSSGYYGQDISIQKYGETNEFIKCSLDLSIMTMTIVCKTILVEEVKMEDMSFFWKKK